MQKRSEIAIALLDARDLLSGDPFDAILKALGAQPSQTGPSEHAVTLGRILDAARKAGPTPVLLVDDADQLSEAAMPTLAFLTGGATGPAKMKLILTGTPDLFGWLQERLPDLVGPTFELTEMSEADTAAYIRHFLAAEGNDVGLFDDKALAEIHKHAGGLPLRINAICQTCLAKAAKEGLPRIDASMVRRAVIIVGIRGSSGDAGGGWEGLTGDDARADLPHVSEDPPGSDPATNKRKAFDPATRLESILHGGGPTKREAKDAGTTAQDSPGRRRRTGLLVASAAALTLALGMAAVLLPSRGTTDGTRIASAMDGAERFLQRVMGGSEVAGVQTMPADQQRLVEDRVARILGAMSDFPENAEDRFRYAVTAGEKDPELAVVGYARAALMGHERAAYYLGQIYETGEGVPVDRSLARAWYLQSGSGIRGAEQRLAELAEPEAEGALRTPLPLFAGRGQQAWVELVWTSAAGPDPSFYRVEFATADGNIVMRAEPIATSALRMSLPGNAVKWRVIAVDADRSVEAASPWLSIGGE